MIPNLDFMRTMLNGICESVFVRIKNVAAGLESKIEDVNAKVQTPDYEAAAGEPGYIRNKPALIGQPGTGLSAEVFNDTTTNVASGEYAHAEGYLTTASHQASHAEGRHTTASADHTHAEGFLTVASATDAHAEGSNTVAASVQQHVQGRFNIEDRTNKRAHIVGNGKDLRRRSNAHTLDWDGNAWFAGDVYVGSTSGIDRDEGSRKLVSRWEELPDKPFGSKTVSEEILPETTLTGFSSNGGFTYKSLSDTDYDLIAGETYVVDWNGAEYICTAQAYADSNTGVTGVVLGETNPWVYGAPAGNGEPFGIACMKANGASVYTEIISHESLTSVTAAIVHAAEAVTPLEEKYLPASVFRNGDAGLILTSPGGRRFKVTVDDRGALGAAEVLE